MNMMATPRKVRGMTDEQSKELDVAIDARLAKSRQQGIEILNRSQQKLKDAEDQVFVARRDKNAFDKRIASTKEQIARLNQLMALDERDSIDLGYAIAADLQLIHSLRENGIELPIVDESMGQDEQQNQ